MPVEVVYDYIKKRHELSRDAFSAFFPAPALLFERVMPNKGEDERTHTDIEAVSPAGTQKFLAQFALRLREEAHLLRIVRLPRDGTLGIGRTAGNSLILASRSVSKNHARIICDNGRVMLSDLGSRNGVFVDDTKIQARTSVQVHTGQTIRIGPIPLRVLSGPDLYQELDTLTIRSEARIF